MPTLLVAPTLTSQVRDLVYTLGQQATAAATLARSVSRTKPSRTIGTTYVNSDASVRYIFVSLVTATSPSTSYLFIGNVEVAQGQHVTTGQAQMLAGIVNPNELYYVTTTASGATALDWIEYAL